MKTKVCVIGSGAGAGPIIAELSAAGHEVVVLEKGPWIKTDQFTKDEMVATRRAVYVPNLRDERHVLEKPKDEGWETKSTYQTGVDFWNGSVVGGSSNFMSGYFHRMKPNDFKLKSVYGPVEGANIEDWPLSYEDMEPYYTKVEEEIGVSGKAVHHKYKAPRSTKDYPYPPLAENIISEKLDAVGERLGVQMVPVPRAILSRSKENRKPCYLSNYCGSYGCSSDAKGSSRAALLNKAVDTGYCTIIPNAKVFYLETDGAAKLKKAWYYDKEGAKQSIEADVFVVACQAVETSRLLLSSASKAFPNGLANNSGQVGRNLLFSGGGSGSGRIMLKDLSAEEAKKIQLPGLFVNRSIHDWYEVEDASSKIIKGGIIDFLWEHANPVTAAVRQKYDDGDILYGKDLKRKLEWHHKEQRRLRYEIFVDWTPTDNCHVSLSKSVKDKWGDPVAHLKLGYHERDIEVGKILAKKGKKIMEALNAAEIKYSVNGNPPPNLQAGGCRFGDDKRKSVLDVNCKAHEVDNLYITDGSFMPTGGSSTYTWTIYANSYRVADHLLQVL